MCQSSVFLVVPVLDGVFLIRNRRSNTSQFVQVKNDVDDFIVGCFEGRVNLFDTIFGKVLPRSGSWSLMIRFGRSVVTFGQPTTFHTNGW